MLLSLLLRQLLVSVRLLLSLAVALSQLGLELLLHLLELLYLLPAQSSQLEDLVIIRLAVLLSSPRFL